MSIQYEKKTTTLLQETGVKIVTTETARDHALEVLHAIYCREKKWMDSAEILFEPHELYEPNYLWLVAYERNRPIGVVRLYIGRQAEALDLKHLHFLHADWNASALTHFLEYHPTAEIGRFAILPEYRNRSRFALMLMQVACENAIRHHCHHLLTDVFHGDPQSPFDFHTNVLGFEPFATYVDDRFDSVYPSVLLLLDIKKTYARMKTHQPRMFKVFTQNWTTSFHAQLT